MTNRFIACRTWLVCIALMLYPCGCNRTKEPVDASLVDTPTVPLRVLVLDDEELAAIVKQEWDSRAGSSRVMTKASAAVLAADAERLNADVVIYPSGLLGELAERELIIPLNEDGLREEAFNRADLFHLTRLREVVWGRETLAVSFGSPQLTLFYRKDVFARLNLKPPKTWEDYAELVEQLSDRGALGDLAPADDQPWYATVEPTADGWSGSLLLARAAAYARHPSQYSTIFEYTMMEPLISGPPFVRALTELVVANKQGAPGLNPTEARRIFLAGHAAMALTWPSRADDASPESPEEREDWIGVAELPGARAVYNVRSQSWQSRDDKDEGRATLLGIAGRLGSVTRECRRNKQASQMLMLLTGEELGAAISAASKHTTLSRTTHVGRESVWVDRSLAGDPATAYAEAVQTAQSRSTWVAAVRIPGRANYLAALDQAVAQALTDQTAPSDALANCSQQWSKITGELGVEKQRTAYTRSLGLNP